MKETATFGNGCFWCTEAIFNELKGVMSVESGYTGGTIDHPTYEQICTGTTGHAEVIQVSFDSEQVSFEVLLNMFFATHDPTTLNQQGNDVGTQYRSAIFYTSEMQKEIAGKVKKEIDNSGTWSNPIVTEISPLGDCYSAGSYHQDYFKMNDSQPYCSFIIRPKLEKFRKEFSTYLK